MPEQGSRPIPDELDAGEWYLVTVVRQRAILDEPEQERRRLGLRVKAHTPHAALQQAARAYQEEV